MRVLPRGLDGKGWGKIRSWVIQGAVALADQGVYSGTNFVVNVLLARWLAPEGYGAFTVGFSVFLFLAGFHSALILEPMSVIGPARYGSSLGEYLRGQVRLHAVGTLPLGGILVAAGLAVLLVRDSLPLGTCLLGVGILLPSLLLAWLVRRAFYVLRRPGQSLLNNALYFITCLAAIFVLRRVQALSPLTGFVAMALAGVFSGLVGYGWLLRHSSESHLAIPSWTGLLREQWRYGRWVVVSTALSAFTGQFQTWFAAGQLGLEAAGALRAMQNLMLPMGLAVTAISSLALPALSACFGQGDLVDLRRKGVLVTAALTTLAAAYEVGLLVFGRGIEYLLYRGKFAAYTDLIALVGLVPVFTALGSGYSLMLRAVQRPEHYLLAGAVVAPISLVATITFTKWWGVIGVAASTLTAPAASAGVAAYLCRIWFPCGGNAYAISSTQGQYWNLLPRDPGSRTTKST